jgi:1-pyrroline-5-carboxylate dehydrogenase
MERMAGEKIDIPLIIGGKEVRTGKTGLSVMPHDHGYVLAEYHKAGEGEIRMAVEAALAAHHDWETMPWIERVSIGNRAAELIHHKYRYILNASTMLNQSKTVHQSEIDAACEVADFLRFNSYFMNFIYAEQPFSPPGELNRMEFRALEGFVFAVTPFNFTSIAANLPTAPALMGNTVLWKPASSSVFSGYYLMKLFQEAGFPDGVINFIPGSGAVVGDLILQEPMLAGIHFTGSTDVFRGIWRKVGENIAMYRSYPRIVGETGGKDFVIVHPSADAQETAVGLVRGAFEYQGQKCSAASRAYIPQSLWPKIKDSMMDMLAQIKMGSPMDFKNFMNAVIDEGAFDRIMDYINTAKESTDTDILFGGNGDKSSGYFIEPTVVLTKDPHFITMEEEIFGPVLTIYIYDDNEFEQTLHLCNETSPYALTGAIFARERKAIIQAENILSYAAGNFYINDKPTGAVVGQQPFGGSRASGTNDKAGSHLNLIRWAIPRVIKENLYPPTDFRYQYMED